MLSLPRGVRISKNEDSRKEIEDIKNNRSHENENETTNFEKILGEKIRKIGKRKK